MKERNILNEFAIKHALTQGYITAKEADVMLKNYVHRSKLSKSPSSKPRVNITA